MRPWLLSASVGVALTAVGAGMFWWGRAGAAAGPAAPPAARPAYVAAEGVVEGARPEVALRPEVLGTIAALLVRENADVTRGTPLVELHNETQKQQVVLAEAELGVARAEREVVRTSPRLEMQMAAVMSEKIGQMPQLQTIQARAKEVAATRTRPEERPETVEMLNKIKAQFAAAQVAPKPAPPPPAPRADVVAADARITVAEARLQLARAELAETRLLAPGNGRIVRVCAEPGELAGPASPQPLLLLADLSVRRVRAFVEELDAPRVRVGQRAMVTADGLPGKEFAGVVAVVLPRMGKRAPHSDAAGEYRDVYYREVLLDLDAADELPLNLRVQTRIQAR